MTLSEEQRAKIAQIKAYDAGEPIPEVEAEYIPTNSEGERLVQSNFLNEQAALWGE